MAMQPRALMTSYLFSPWLLHLIKNVLRLGGILPEQRHLLVLDRHISQVFLEVVVEAKNAGVDLVTLPSYTSHALQPLDICVFKPFKQYFKEYYDYWTSRNLDQAASKETLAHWVALALRRALSRNNLEKDFISTGI